MNDEDEYLKLLAYVKINEYRSKVMEYLSDKDYDFPVNIANGVGIRTNHISMTLSQLKKHGLVECINPEARKGRLYRLTQVGVKIMDYSKQIK